LTENMLMHFTKVTTITVVRFNFLDFTEQPVEGLFAGPWRAISEVVATWGI